MLELRISDRSFFSNKMSHLEAENENTSPDRLRELARNSNPTIRQKVAANPNTPTDVLLDLGAEFFNELIDNPVFDLLLLENPNLAEEISIETLETIAGLKPRFTYFNSDCL